MLQIEIEHYKDGTISIQEIRNDSDVLSVMQDNGIIDLDVCISYINEKIKVHHNYINDEEKSYILTAKLEAVEIDPITQVKCIKYTPIN